MLSITEIIGLYHEHQRLDRNTYVKVNWANVKPDEKADYEIKDASLNLDYWGPYDYSSIMHYSRQHNDATGGDALETVYAPPGPLTSFKLKPDTILSSPGTDNGVPYWQNMKPSTADGNRLCKIYASVCPRAILCSSHQLNVHCTPAYPCNKSTCRQDGGPPCCYNDPEVCLDKIQWCSDNGCNSLQ